MQLEYSLSIKTQEDDRNFQFYCDADFIGIECGRDRLVLNHEEFQQIVDTVKTYESLLAIAKKSQQAWE